MSAEPGFFICRHCGNLMIQKRIHANAKKKAEKDGVLITCCGQLMSRLVANVEDTCEEQHIPKYTIKGGFANNAVEVRIGRTDHVMTEEHHIEWVYMYTFQGGQLKYLHATQEPKVTFAMADEDAFVYCDRPVCKMGRDHCMFQCKRDLIVYAYCNLHGLWKTRM
ncbi:MAG: desulfoferrodoxin family protein [Pseudomonadota bacterium]